MRFIGSWSAAVVMLGIPSAALADYADSFGVGVAYGGLGLNRESSGDRTTIGIGSGPLGYSTSVNLYVTDRRDGFGRPMGPRVRLSAGGFWYPVGAAAAVTVGSRGRHWDVGAGAGVVTTVYPEHRDLAIIPVLDVGYRF